jgi:hypothetical protein
MNWDAIKYYSGMFVALLLLTYIVWLILKYIGHLI